MRRVVQWSLLSVLCLLGIEHGQAQPGACGRDYGCIEDDATAAPQPLAVKPASLAGLEPCLEGPVDVAAASPDEHRLACSAAGDAIQLLDRCGISLHRPLRVEIMSEVRHPLREDPIFGLFDKKLEQVLITQEANIAPLVKGTPYAELPQRDFYRSLIVHEVIHGIMHQNLKWQPTSHAAYEYPAYALQIASLPSDVREKFLQSLPNRARPGEFVFSDVFLFFDPFFFAANAYEHFKASPDGCAHVNALLGGEVTFIPTLPR